MQSATVFSQVKGVVGDDECCKNFVGQRINNPEMVIPYSSICSGVEEVFSSRNTTISFNAITVCGLNAFCDHIGKDKDGERIRSLQFGHIISCSCGKGDMNWTQIEQLRRVKLIDVLERLWDIMQRPKTKYHLRDFKIFTFEHYIILDNFHMPRIFGLPTAPADVIEVMHRYAEWTTSLITSEFLTDLALPLTNLFVPEGPNTYLKIDKIPNLCVLGKKSKISSLDEKLTFF